MAEWLKDKVRSKLQNPAISECLLRKPSLTQPFNWLNCKGRNALYNLNKTSNRKRVFVAWLWMPELRGKRLWYSQQIVISWLHVEHDFSVQQDVSDTCCILNVYVTHMSYFSILTTTVSLFQSCSKSSSPCFHFTLLFPLTIHYLIHFH